MAKGLEDVLMRSSSEESTVARIHMVAFGEEDTFGSGAVGVETTENESREMRSSDMNLCDLRHFRTGHHNRMVHH